MEKPKDELLIIAAAFQQAEIIENETTEEPAPVAQREGEIVQTADGAQSETDTSDTDTQPGHEDWSEAATEENAPDNPGEPSDNVADYLPASVEAQGEAQPEGHTDIESIIATAYEENKKIVKVRRADKTEFRQAVIEKSLEKAIADNITAPETIAELVLSNIRLYLTDLTAFVPMNDNEHKMLETIPLLADYENTDSRVDGKNFLQKVKELHNIEVAISRALMVSLKKKKYISIGKEKKSIWQKYHKSITVVTLPRCSTVMRATHRMRPLYIHYTAAAFLNQGGSCIMLENLKDRVHYGIEELFSTAEVDKLTGDMTAYKDKLATIARIAEILGIDTEMTEVSLKLKESG